MNLKKANVEKKAVNSPTSSRPAKAIRKKGTVGDLLRAFEQMHEKGIRLDLKP